ASKSNGANVSPCFRSSLLALNVVAFIGVNGLVSVLFSITARPAIVAGVFFWLFLQTCCVTMFGCIGARLVRRDMNAFCKRAGNTAALQARVVELRQRMRTLSTAVVVG